MTHTALLAQHQAALVLLTSTLAENAMYVGEFGYPSGKFCPHCSREVFAKPEALDELAQAPAGTGLAHDHCHAIAGLKEALKKAEEARPHITLIEMPKQVDADIQPAKEEDKNACA